MHRPSIYSCDSCVLSVASEQNSSACSKNPLYPCNPCSKKIAICGFCALGLWALATVGTQEPAGQPPGTC